MTATLLSLTVLFLLCVRATHAGALWRDECGALQLARMATFANVVKNFHRESFPLLFPTTIRIYTALFGTSDASLRCFGLGVGIGLVVVAWFNSRVVNGEVPLLFLALVALNTTLLTWGSTIRGYGIGTVLIALALGLTVKLLFETTAWLVTSAFFVFLASVQCLFFNSALVFGIASAAITVCLVRRRFKPALALLVIGAVCAFSDIPYLKSYFSMDWNIVLRFPGSFFPRFWQQLNLAFGNPISIMPWIWYFIFFASTAGAVWRLRAIWERKPSPEWDLLMFGLGASLISMAAYYAFLRFVSYPSAPWHFLALITVLAALFDVFVANLSRIYWVRLTRLAFVIAALIALPFAAWPKIIERQTNIDVIARKLEKDVAPNDLIIVNPWYLGVTFNHYYHGSAPWITAPTISEHQTHRDDLMKAKMMAADPLRDVRDAIGRTLESGNRVWLVGGAAVPADLDRPPSLLPAPQSEFGWRPAPYLSAWSQELAAFVLKHSLQGEIAMPKSSNVNELENVPLWMAHGWQD